MAKDRHNLERLLQAAFDFHCRQRALAVNPVANKKSLPAKLFDVIEQPLILAAVFAVCGLVGALFFTPAFIVCAICILLGVHRTGVLAGQSLKVQTTLYVALALVLSIGGYFLYGSLNKELERFQIAFAKKVAAFLKADLIKETSINKVPPPPLPPKRPTLFDIDLAKWRLENLPDSLELHDLFLLDSHASQNQFGAIFVDDAHTIKVQYGINVELASRSKFLSFYIDRQDQRTAPICEYLATKHQWLLDNAPQMLIEEKTPGDSGTVSTKEAVFSKRIYIYHETYLPAETAVKLTDFYNKLGLSAIFRSTDYLSTKKLEANLVKVRKEQAAH